MNMMKEVVETPPRGDVIFFGKAYAQYAVADAVMLTQVPSGVPVEDACAPVALGPKPLETARTSRFHQVFGRFVDDFRWLFNVFVDIFDHF